MIQLLALYKWTLLAGLFFSVSLSLLGCQLAARDRSMQTVCVSQGAMLGVLLSLGLTGILGSFQDIEHGDPSTHFAPFAASLLFSGLTFFVTGRLAGRRQVSKNTLFACIFAVLLASSYFVSALFPALENHMAQIYFGDLATVTETDAIMTLVLGIFGVLALGGLWKQVSNQSFEQAVFGDALALTRSRRKGWLFDGVALITLCFSVQFLGFLFTISCLFLPTTILTYLPQKGLARHLFLSCLVALLGTAAGFVASLHFTRFPTVPTVALAMLAWGLLFVLLGKIMKNSS